MQQPYFYRDAPPHLLERIWKKTAREGSHDGTVGGSGWLDDGSVGLSPVRSPRSASRVSRSAEALSVSGAADPSALSVALFSGGDWSPTSSGTPKSRAHSPKSASPPPAWNTSYASSCRSNRSSGGFEKAACHAARCWRCQRIVKLPQAGRTSQRCPFCNQTVDRASKVILWTPSVPDIVPYPEELS